MSEVNQISNVNRNNATSLNTTNTSKTTAGKTSFSSYLEESKSLDEIFEAAAKKYNVSVNLLKAVGKAESGFNADAVSSCGAQGIMQLMPATAASLGVTDAFDAEQNIMGGANYISGLLKKYNGNTTLALAAYNAGSGNVAKYGGVPPFKETQNYVVKVLNYMKQGVSTEGAAAVVSALAANTNTSGVTGAYTKLTPAAEQDDALYVDDTSLSQKINALFSYDDYLKFLDEFSKQEDENKEEDNSSNYFASQSIHINAPVLNLLSQIT